MPLGIDARCCSKANECAIDVERCALFTAAPAIALDGRRAGGERAEKQPPRDWVYRYRFFYHLPDSLLLFFLLLSLSACAISVHSIPFLYTFSPLRLFLSTVSFGRVDMSSLEL